MYTSRPQLRGLALLAVVVLIAVSCGSSGDDTEVAESTTTAAPEISQTATSDTAAPVDDTDDDSATDVGSMPDPQFQEELRIRREYITHDGIGLIESNLGYAPVLLEAGTYDTDAMFTPMRFTLSEPIRLIVERPGVMTVVDHSAGQLWEPPLMQWKRPHKLTDPATTADGPPPWPGWIDGWDFDAWFAAHPAIDVVKTDLVVSGLDSVRYDVSYDGSADVGWSCGGRICVPLFLDYGGVGDFQSEQLHRLWVVPQGDFDPIVAVAAVDAADGWGDFGDRLDAIIESVELGAPTPVGFSENTWEDGLNWWVPPGNVTFPILSGVEFEMPKEYFVWQSKNHSYIDMIDEEFDAFPPNVEIAAAMQTIDGAPIESAEQLAALMVDRAGATRLPDAELAGRPAIVVEMLGVQPDIPIFRHVALPDGVDPALAAWFTQDFVQLWAVDTDEGVLIVTAEGEGQSALDVALELQRQVRESVVILE